MNSIFISKKSELAKILKAMEKVKSKDQTKPYICKVYYDAERRTIVSTNGNALLVYKTEILFSNGISDNCYLSYTGDYLVTLSLNGSSYPNYEKILPAIGKDTFYNQALELDGKMNFSYIWSLYLASYGVYINGALLNDLKSICDMFSNVAIHNDQPNIKPVVFFNVKRDLIYIQMPIINKQYKPLKDIA